MGKRSGTLNLFHIIDRLLHWKRFTMNDFCVSFEFTPSFQTNAKKTFQKRVNERFFQENRSFGNVLRKDYCKRGVLKNYVNHLEDNRHFWFAGTSWLKSFIVPGWRFFSDVKHSGPLPCCTLAGKKLPVFLWWQFLLVALGKKRHFSLGAVSSSWRVQQMFPIPMIFRSFVTLVDAL